MVIFHSSPTLMCRVFVFSSVSARPPPRPPPVLLPHSHSLTHSHSLSLSLTLTHSRTHALTHSLTLTHTHSLTLTHSHSLSLTHPHSLSLTLTHPHSHSLTLTLTHTHSLTLTHTHSHSRTHTHSLALTHTHSLTLTHSHSFSLTHPHSLSLTLTHSLTLTLTHSPSLSLTHSHSLTHPHSLAHSLTQSLTPSLTQSLTHSLTLSHTHSHTHPHSHSLTHSPSLTHSLPRGRMYALAPLWRSLGSAAFAWQAWDNLHCQGVGCTPWRPSGVPWAPPLLRGRRGTISTAKGRMHALASLWRSLGSVAFAWQAWDNLHCQGLAFLGLRRFCVAGVGQSPLPRGRVYALASLWRSLGSAAFARQAWDNLHCQGVGCMPWRPSGVPWAPSLLRGRRGTISLPRGRMYALASSGVPWAPSLLRGRRGTISTAKGSDARPGVPLAFRGRRGTISTAKGSDVCPGAPLAFLGLRRFCVAGVGQSPLPRGRMHALASLWRSLGSAAFAWQAWDKLRFHSHFHFHFHSHSLPLTHSFPLTHSLHSLTHSHSLTHCRQKSFSWEAHPGTGGAFGPRAFALFLFVCSSSWLRGMHKILAATRCRHHKRHQTYEVHSQGLGWVVFSIQCLANSGGVGTSRCRGAWRAHVFWWARCDAGFRYI